VREGSAPPEMPWHVSALLLYFDKLVLQVP
jgi:hypothetical protein